MGLLIATEARSSEYWLGYLAKAVEMAVDEIERETCGPKETGASLKRTLREYLSSPARDRDRQIVAYAVVDALDECYAIVTDRVEAEKMRSQGYDYLLGAESCGHQRAGGWVRERIPFAVLTITEEERVAYLAEGTPVLEREP